MSMRPMDAVSPQEHERIKQRIRSALQTRRVSNTSYDQTIDASTNRVSSIGAMAKWRTRVHDMYHNRHWGPEDTDRPQINRLRVEILAIVGSVMYSRLAPSVAPSAHHPLPLSEGQTPQDAADLTATLFEQWCRQDMVKDAIQHALVLALVDSDSALDVVLLPSLDLHPFDAVRVYPRGQDETFWDRAAPEHEQMSYTGCAVLKELAEVQAMVPDDEELKARLANIAKRYQSVQFGHERQRVLYVEFHDLRGTFDVDLTTPIDALGAGSPLTEEPNRVGEPQKTVLPGRVVYAAVNPDSWMQGEVVLLGEGAAPWAGETGSALSPIIPCILQRHLDEKMSGVSTGDVLYSVLANKYNLASFQSDGAMGEAALNNMVVMSGELDSNDLDVILKQTGVRRITRPAKMTGDPNLPLIERLPQQTTSGIIRDALSTSEEDFEHVSAPLPRGQGLNYASATEAQIIGHYSETNIGQIRQRLDITVSKLFTVWRIAMAAAVDARAKRDMEQSDAAVAGIVLELPTGQHLEYPLEWLKHPWRIVPDEDAKTPFAENTRRQEFSQVLPMLLGCADAMADPNPWKRVVAKASLGKLQELYKLGPEFDTDRLEANAMKMAQTALATTPEQPAPGGPPPGGALPR